MKNELSHSHTIVVPTEDCFSFTVSSIDWVVLDSGIAYSQIICDVVDVSLQTGLLLGTANLCDTIQGTCPWVSVQSDIWPPTYSSLSLE